MSDNVYSLQGSDSAADYYSNLVFSADSATTLYTSDKDNDSITASEYADYILTTGSSAVVSALSGGDYIISRGGNASIFGGNGNDTVYLYTSNGSSGGSPGSSLGANGGHSTIYGDSGDDVLIIGTDSNIVYGNNGDDMMMVQIYEAPGFAIDSLRNITLTGGEGRDTFAFNTTIPSDIEKFATVSGTRIEAVITDFSASEVFLFDSLTSSFTYSVSGSNDDIVLTSNSGYVNVTLQGINDIENVVFATAGRAVNDSITTMTFGEMLTNYNEDTSALPTGLSYENYTVYVTNNYSRDIWLSGRDIINNVSTYRNLLATIIDARQSTRGRVLVGNSRNNVIRASSGGDSMWGGEGNTNDTLYGGNSRDMFWFGEDNGTDVFRDFKFGTDADSDVINFYTDGAVSIYRMNDTVHIGMSAGSELLLPTTYVVDSEIQYSTNAGNSISRVKCGERDSLNSLTYSFDVNIFAGGNLSDTIRVADSKTDYVWLDGSHGQTFYDIEVIDATDSYGNNQLVGNELANSIVGGHGYCSLWGGGNSGDSDTLIGGEGSDTFFIGKNQGNDYISGASSNDTINLMDISLGDISSFSYEKGVSLTFKNGGSLSVVDSSSSPVFNLAYGGAWTYSGGGRWSAYDG